LTLAKKNQKNVKIKQTKLKTKQNKQNKIGENNNQKFYGDADQTERNGKGHIRTLEEDQDAL
jgi:acid phosphatase class B